MTKNILLGGLLLCFFLAPKTFGGERAGNTATRQALVFSPHHDAIRGKLVEVRNEYVVVLTSEREVMVPFSEISRIILTHEQRSPSGPLYGMVLGGYAGMYLVATARGQGGYVESRSGWGSGTIFFAFISLAAGGGMGYLVDPGLTTKDEVFDFTGSDEEQLAEQSRLALAVRGELRESKVHFTIQGSRVYTSVPTISLPRSFEYSSVTKFNLLRRAQVTYSVLPRVEAGIALVWFGEPAQSVSAYQSLGNGDSKSYTGSQTFEATGKYVVALYRPLHQILKPPLGVRIGGGLGSASVEFNRKVSVSTYMQGGGPSVQQTSTFNVSDNFLVGYLVGQLDIELSEGLALGLVADKVFGPSRKAPGVPEANIPPQTVRFENASVGFTINLHF